MGRTYRKRHRQNQKIRPESRDLDDKIIKLKQWMKVEAAFSCDLIPAMFSDTGRGAMTKTRIQPGEIVISLPSTLLITTRTVLQSEIGDHIKGWLPRLTPQQCLSVYLIWEKSKESNSSWYPYLDVLPDSFSTPGYFTQTELSYLPESVRESAVSEQGKVLKGYRTVSHYAKRHWSRFNSILTFADFRWAWYVINTRSVYLASEPSEYLCNSESDNIALAPFLDLLNHSPAANIKAGLNKSTGCYEIQTYDSYRPYQQVFISYGAHSNKKLFLDYGFCVPNNLQDEFEICSSIVWQMVEQFKVDNLTKKYNILKENDLVQSLMCSQEGLSWKLSVVLKTMFMDWQELQHWTRVYSDDTSESQRPRGKALQLARKLLQYYHHKTSDQLKYILNNKTDSDNPERVNIALTLVNMEKQIIVESLRQIT